MWLIHGHTHSTDKKINYENKSICVSVENWDYKPVDAEVIIQAIRGARNGL